MTQREVLNPHSESFVPPNILACISCWDNVKPDFLKLMMGLSTSGILNGYIIMEGTLLPRSRNDCVHAMYKHHPQATHLLFIDADMGNFSPDMLRKMVLYDVDIVACLATQRRPPFLPAPCPLHVHTNRPILDKLQELANKEDVDPLVPAYHVGMATTLVKREIFDRMLETYNYNNDTDDFAWFACDREPDWERVNSKIEELVRDEESSREAMKKISRFVAKEAYGGYPVGEDVFFCNRARELGYKIYIDCSLPVSHIGDCAYDIRHHLAHIRKEKNASGNGKLHSEPRDPGNQGIICELEGEHCSGSPGNERFPNSGSKDVISKAGSGRLILPK